MRRDRSDRWSGHLSGSSTRSRASGLVGAVGAGVAVAMVATACSGPPTASALHAPATGASSLAGELATASKTTAGVHTFHASVSVTGGSGGASTTYLTGQASVDTQARTGTASLQVAALGGSTGSTGSTTVTVVADGSTIYLDIPAQSALTGGKAWLSLPERSGVGSSGLALTDTALGNPSDMLRLLAAHASSVTNVGTPTVDGQATTEYRAVISVAEIEAQAASHNRRRLATAARRTITALGVTSIPVTVWIGSDGYLRQVQFVVDLSHARLGSVLGSLVPPGPLPVVTVTVAFSGYGSPVTVTDPPASQTASGSSVLRTLLGDLGTGSSGTGGGSLGGGSGSMSA